MSRASWNLVTARTVIANRGWKGNKRDEGRRDTSVSGRADQGATLCHSLPTLGRTIRQLRLFLVFKNEQSRNFEISGLVKRDFSSRLNRFNTHTCTERRLLYIFLPEADKSIPPVPSRVLILDVEEQPARQEDGAHRSLFSDFRFFSSRVKQARVDLRRGCDGAEIDFSGTEKDDN